MTGASPQVGDQIGLRYVLKAYVREREVIVEDNTKGKAKDFRFGVGQLLPGMDEAWKILRISGNFCWKTAEYNHFYCDDRIIVLNGQFSEVPKLC